LEKPGKTPGKPQVNPWKSLGKHQEATGGLSIAMFFHPLGPVFGAGQEKASSVQATSVLLKTPKKGVFIDSGRELDTYEIS